MIRLPAMEARTGWTAD